MRIAHVTSTFPPYMGGTGNVCYYNALGLARSGHQVSVYTAGVPSQNAFDPPGVTVRRLPAILRFGNVPLLPGLLRIRDVDIIHLHYPFIFGAELVWLVSKVRGIPYVVTYHNDLLGEGFRKLLFNAYLAISAGTILGGAKKIAVVSPEHARSSKMAPLFQKRQNDIVEIPNGVDLNRFHPSDAGMDIRRRYGIARDENVILFVGALDRAHYFKGINHLLEAFSRIIKGDTYLLIVGEGEWKARYRNMAAEFNVLPQTIFAGHVSDEDLPSYYNCADLLVLPSIRLESFGLVLVEAMACGKPVVASDLPGVRSVVSDTSDGFLVPPSDVKTLSEKIQYLLDNPAVGRQMGIRAQAKVEAKYAWPKIIPRLIRLYEGIYDQKNHAHADDRMIEEDAK